MNLLPWPEWQQAAPERPREEVGLGRIEEEEEWEREQAARTVSTHHAQTPSSSFVREA